MYRQARGLTSYGRMANAETDPVKQVVMLYDGAIKFLNLSAEDIAAGDFAAKGEHSNRAFDILNYLQSILDFKRGGAVAETLDTLYGSVTRMALRASVTSDAAMMRRAGELLLPVRNAWETNAQAAANMSAPPVENSGFAMAG